MTDNSIISVLTKSIDEEKSINITFLKENDLFGYYLTLDFNDGSRFQTRRVFGFPSLERAFNASWYDFEVRKEKPIDFSYGWMQVGEFLQRIKC